MWVRSLSRSLRVVQFESLGTISHLPSIVTVALSLAISEIFSVNEWPDLEIWVWGRSRSLKMAPFDRQWLSISPPSLCKRKISSAEVQLYYNVIIRIYLTSVPYPGQLWYDGSRIEEKRIKGKRKIGKRYRAMLETLLSYGEDSKKSQLTSEIYHPYLTCQGW